MREKNLIFITALLVFFASLFTACEGDTGDDVTSDPLTISVTETDSPTYTPGSMVYFEIKVSSGEKMKTLTVMANNAEVYSKDLNNQTGTVTLTDFVLEIPADANAGDQISLLFTAEDKEGTKTYSTSITVVAEETPLTNNQNGVIYHILGPNQGAWDLVNNTGVSWGSASNKYVADNKDMIHVAQMDNNVTTFEKKFVAGNATRFVKTSGFDYDNATIEAAMAAYAAGTPLGDHNYTLSNGSTFDTSDGNPVEVDAGDVVVAKLRGGNNYAVIKIEEINETEGDNEDSIVFSYKKASSVKVAGKTLMTYR